MFSGIVESTQPVLSARTEGEVIRIQIQRPAEFTDLKIGDSIACNGVCLTIEAFDQKQMQFAIGLETQKVLGLHGKLEGAFQLPTINLERSLKFGDRIHGHFVTGHAEGSGVIARRKEEGECLWLWIDLPQDAKNKTWVKGSITLNGVSLTVNGMAGAHGTTVEVCLIPETLKKTNLGALAEGARVTFETDWLGKLFRETVPSSDKSSPSLLRVNPDGAN